MKNTGRSQNLGRTFELPYSSYSVTFYAVLFQQRGKVEQNVRLQSSWLSLGC